LRPLRWHSPEFNLVIWSFAKAGSQIIQKIFAETLGWSSLDFSSQFKMVQLSEEEIINNNNHWIMIRDHESRVLSTFYEKQLSWHEVPNNNVATWGHPCRYNQFIHQNLPIKIYKNPNRHVIPFTSFTSVADVSFSKKYFMNQTPNLVKDFCNLSGKNFEDLRSVVEKKLFHSIPYINSQDANNFLEDLEADPWDLSPEDIKEKKLYFRKDTMNNDDIKAALRIHYKKDFEKFPELKF